MIVIYLLAIASAWQRAVADSDACSSSVTISSQSDADMLRSCDTFDGSITISPSTSGVITLNNVEEIKGALIAEGASELTGLFAPDLDSVKGGITLSNLNSLTTITMGALSEVSSAIIITGNPNLKTLEFQDLEKVEGQLELAGSFDSVSLPSLDQVKGQTTIIGSSSMLCSALDSLKSHKVFRNGYVCSSGSSGLSPGAKGGIAVGVIVAVLLIVLLLWFMLRRRQRQRTRGVQSTIPPSSTLSTTVGHGEKALISQGSISPQQESLRSEEPQTLLPRKPVGSAILLDGRSVYEAGNGSTPVHEYHELDAGPVFSSHQRPIHAN